MTLTNLTLADLRLATLTLALLTQIDPDQSNKLGHIDQGVSV
jgi:hypothetical protein